MSQAAQSALFLAGILIAIGVIGRSVQWLWVTLSKLARLADGLLGEPPSPGAPNGRPGVLDRLGTIEDLVKAQDTRVRYLEEQMRPNGGTSLRDTVDRIAASASEVST